MFGRDFDDNFFDRLDGLAVFFVGDDLRAADFKFVAFAAHGFDQARQGAVRRGRRP